MGDTTPPPLFSTTVDFSSTTTTEASTPWTDEPTSAVVTTEPSAALVRSHVWILSLQAWTIAGVFCWLAVAISFRHIYNHLKVRSVLLCVGYP